MRRLAVFAFVVLLAGASGCVTPSIPIPPPDPARMTFHLSVIDGVPVAEFTYPPDQNYHDGVVYLYNRNLGEGRIKYVNADDSIGPVQMTASENDEVVVTIETPDQTSSTCVRVREGTGQDANSCSF